MNGYEWFLRDLWFYWIKPKGDNLCSLALRNTSFSAFCDFDFKGMIALNKAVFCEALTSSLTFWSNQKWSLEVYIVLHSDVSTWNLSAKFNISWSILFTFCSRIRNLLEVRFTLASQAGKTRCTLWIRLSENSKLMFEYERPFKGVICLLIACSFFVWCVWLAIRSLTRN